MLLIKLLFQTKKKLQNLETFFITLFSEYKKIIKNLQCWVHFLGANGIQDK